MCYNIKMQHSSHWEPGSASQNKTFIYALVYIYSLLEKYRPGGFQWSMLGWGDLEPSYTCMNFFSHLSIVSVEGKQHLSEVVLSAVVGFSFYRKWWVSGRTYTPRTCHQWLWCSWSRGHCSWSSECPVSPGCTGKTRHLSFSL